MSTVATLLAQAPLPPAPGDTVSLGEAIAFWVLGPLALAGGLGMVFARNAVHSALLLALAMLCLGVLYLVQQAPFLGFVQIIVYTGAVMMLFLFVLMLAGRDNVDSLVEVLRGQRVAAALAGIGLAGLLASVVGRALQGVSSVGLAGVAAGGGNVAILGRRLFTDYVFPFELTSALLITAAVGAMVLTFSGHSEEGRLSQRERVEARVRSMRPAPLPGPGVFATANSVATPALLPDGSVAEASRFEILQSTARERLDANVRSVVDAGTGLDARALRGPATTVSPVSPAAESDPEPSDPEPSDPEPSDPESSGSEPSGSEPSGSGQEAGR